MTKQAPKKITLSGDQAARVRDLYARKLEADERQRNAMALAQAARRESETAERGIKYMVASIATGMKNPVIDISTMEITPKKESDDGVPEDA